MNEKLSIFFCGSLCLAAGALILQNIEALVQFDQQSGTKLNAWFKKRVKNPALNRELWSVGTESGSRNSRIVFRVVGVILILLGVALVGLSFRGR
ncbi:MAG: hypothetical protein WBL56_20065, partial [Candidatus Acidiferrum sp.]